MVDGLGSPGGGGGLFSRVASGTYTGIGSTSTVFASTGVGGQQKAMLAYGSRADDPGQDFKLVPGTNTEATNSIALNAYWDESLSEWYVTIYNDSGETVDIDWQLLELEQP